MNPRALFARLSEEPSAVVSHAGICEGDVEQSAFLPQSANSSIASLDKRVGSAYEPHMKKLVSEFIGTFCLVFTGTGAIIINDVSGGVISHVGVALTFGLVVMAMIHAFGDVSGAHLNPAVTIGLFVARRFERSLVLPYVISQFGGAFAASFVLCFLFPDHATLGATLPAGVASQSFVLEFILTVILMLVILSVTSGAAERRITAGLTIGAVIALGALFAGPICGASMNPARSIAPALVSQHVSHLWLYLTAPVLGAVVAVGVCSCVREEGCCAAQSCS